MTASATIFAPDPAPLTVAVLVLPQASILEVASVLDPLRAANRHLGRVAFVWRVVSPDGRPVPLTCGIALPAAGGLAAAEGADALAVIAGYGDARAPDAALVRALARLAPRLRTVVGIDAGPWVMARAGLLDGHRATVHWEDFEDFAAAFPRVEVVPDRWVISGARATAGGAGPAGDLMLHLVRSRHGAPIAAEVAAGFLTTPRPGDEPQAARPATPALAGDPRVAAAMARIVARLDAPEPVAATARAVGLSVRRLEGLFRTELGRAPAEWGREARLQAARRMVVEGRHPLSEIALRTGFAAQSALSRAFRRRFGVAPSALRKPAAGT
jgi:transcriptional regulator GlxA family with amidase domain